MCPGMTNSVAPFFAPNRLPAESFGPLARPCAWWVACRTNVVGRAIFAEGEVIRKLEKHVQKDELKASVALKGCAILGCNIVVE